MRTEVTEMAVSLIRAAHMPHLVRANLSGPMQRLYQEDPVRNLELARDLLSGEIDQIHRERGEVQYIVPTSNIRHF